MIHLFNRGYFELNCGSVSDFKIDCDALTNADLDVLAYTVIKKFNKFHSVIGIPRGGLRFQYALEQYRSFKGTYTLLVDDVLTTGGSMERARAEIEGDVKGVIIFSRGQCASWITPMFTTLFGSDRISRDEEVCNLLPEEKN